MVISCTRLENFRMHMWLGATKPPEGKFLLQKVVLDLNLYCQHEALQGRNVSEVSAKQF